MSQRSPKYLRCTPGFAVTAFFTAVLALWLTTDVAHATSAPTVWSNGLEIATAAAWLYWTSGVRMERVQNKQADQEIAQLIEQFRSE